MYLLECSRLLTVLVLFPATVFCYVVRPDKGILSSPVLDSRRKLDLAKPLHKRNEIDIQTTKEEDDDTPLPVIIWHGLGDSADAAGLKEISELIDEIHPGTYVQILSLAGSPGSADRQASFFGNVTQQIEQVCEEIAKDNILRTAPAIDAIGFSQGGQFLRGVVERCTSSHTSPRVRSLITFGSQHNGIAEFQKCASATDFICQGANALLRSSTVWSDFIQSRLVPAQYYRSTNDFENYLSHSNFLADINNERKLKNIKYAENLARLDKFVMVMFHNDTTVIPRWSSWFAEVNGTTKEEKEAVTPLRERKIYKEDWIGLKKLDEKGGLVFEEVEGGHMDLEEEDLVRLFKKYLGPLRKNSDDNEGDDDSTEKNRQTLLGIDTNTDLVHVDLVLQGEEGGEL